MDSEQCLHLNTGTPRAKHCRLAVHQRLVPIGGKIDIDAGKRQRMAQGYKITGTLRGLNGGDSGHRNNRALGTLATVNLINNRPTCPQAAGSHCLPVGRLLVTGFNHAGVARIIKMSKFFVRHPLASIRHAARHSAILLVALVLALSPAPAASQGNNTLDLLSDEQLEIFQRDLGRYHFGKGLLDDPVAELYIKRLLNELKPPKRIAISIIDDPSVNALAVQGDMIFIHTGLIEFIDSENELLGVVAHEIGHIVQEHFTRLPKQLQAVSSLAAAALLLGLLSSDAEIGDALIAASQGSLQSAAYEQIRTYEYEADSVALDLLSKSGVGADGLIEILRKLKGAPGVPEYLLTHPISDNRVAAVQGYARQFPTFEPRAESADFGFIQARIRKRSRVSNLSEEISDEPEEIQDYLLLLDKNQASRAAAARLQEKHAGNWIIAHALAELYLAENRTNAAIEVLDNALRSDPKNRVLTALRLEALAKSGESQQVKLALGKLAAGNYASPLIAKTEAQFWAEEKDDYRYRVALARYNYNQGDMNNARKQLDFARELARKEGRGDEPPQVVRIQIKIDSIEKALGVGKEN